MTVCHLTPSLAEELRAASSLQALWDAGELCDCTLLPAGISRECGLRAHRVVLAAASPYCRALLAGPWGAQRGDGCIIDLPTLSAASVQTVLTAIYSGELQARSPAQPRPSNTGEPTSGRQRELTAPLPQLYYTSPG